MNAPDADLERRRDAALARARPVRPGDCARLARLPRRGGTIAACMEAPGSPRIVGILCAADAPEAVESARRWLNAGANALCFPPVSPLPLERRMECVWAVSDFLEAHGRDEPLWMREGLFHPAQISEALEAGVRTLSVYPRVLGDEALAALAAASREAGAECVWEIGDAQDAERAQKCGARAWTVPANARLPQSRLKALPDGGILCGLSEEDVEACPAGFRAVTWAEIPTAEEEARLLLERLRAALPPCGGGDGARARAASSTKARSARRPPGR